MTFNILLQATNASGAGWQGILMMVLIFVVFYFFMIRPQTKRQKEVQKFQNALEKGAKVVTQGGVYGKVKEVKDNIVVLEIAKDVCIQVNKGMVFAAEEPAKQADSKDEKKD
ncbi:MAG: preprotein translocase subunit YajC [Bacteroidales bacterium]|nr:preprotein translocase subunit YajC [Bacteroidales bacterium]